MLRQKVICGSLEKPEIILLGILYHTPTLRTLLGPGQTLLLKSHTLTRPLLLRPRQSRFGI